MVDIFMSLLYLLLILFRERKKKGWIIKVVVIWLWSEDYHLGLEYCVELNSPCTDFSELFCQGLKEKEQNIQF